MSHLRRIAFLLVSIVTLAASDLSAQSNPYYPFRLIPPVLATSPVHARSQATLASDTVLTLPFWDDFSQGSTDAQGFTTPDTLHWEPSAGVLVNAGLAIAPPSVGVASFDGITTRGVAYDTTASSTGLSDQLVSCPINLAAVPEAERGSVYLSFFWQSRGRGEFPEDLGDSLRLQFSTPDTVDQWVTVWQQSGSELLDPEVFVQEILPVNNPAFFHDRFQFRFQSYNRQSGAFDTWNIDYVYLNKGRTANDLAYPDAAITSLPTSIFGPYTMVPMKQFRAEPSRYLAAPSVQYYNLRDRPVGTGFQAFVNNGLTGAVLERISDSINTISPLPTAFDRRTLTVAPPNPDLLDLSQDSLYLETEFYIRTGDKPLIEAIPAPGDTIFNPEVDYRTNDTVRATFVLNETFAYDDGTAEFGLELNQTGGRVAYQFVAPVRDLLTHIDIHFANFAQNRGSLLRLFVWKTLSDTADQEVVLRETGTLPANPATTSNGFISYQLESPITVQDTFYIGYQQESDNRFLIVGFDKNTDTSDRLFFSVSEVWEQNLNLKGSLMMRARFDRERALLVTDLSTEEEVAPEVVVFPNPSTGRFRVQGAYDQLRVLDMLGREVLRTSGAEPTVDLTRYSPGLYVFRFSIDEKIVIRKVLLQP